MANLDTGPVSELGTGFGFWMRMRSRSPLPTGSRRTVTGRNPSAVESLVTSSKAAFRTVPFSLGVIDCTVTCGELNFALSESIVACGIGT